MSDTTGLSVDACCDATRCLTPFRGALRDGAAGRRFGHPRRLGGRKLAREPGEQVGELRPVGRRQAGRRRPEGRSATRALRRRRARGPPGSARCAGRAGRGGSVSALDEAGLGERVDGAAGGRVPRCRCGRRDRSAASGRPRRARRARAAASRSSPGPSSGPPLMRVRCRSTTAELVEDAQRRIALVGHALLLHEAIVVWCCYVLRNDAVSRPATAAPPPDLPGADARAAARVARPDDRLDRAADDRRRPRRHLPPLVGRHRVSAQRRRSPARSTASSATSTAASSCSRPRS